MLWLSLALCFSGFTALCLSMNRHHQQLFEDPPHRLERWIFRIGGWLTLLLASTPCLLELGPSMGLAFWVAEWSVAAMAVLLLLSYRPQIIIPVALGAPFITLPVVLLKQLFAIT